jgi:hypothetical protein
MKWRDKRVKAAMEKLVAPLKTQCARDWSDDVEVESDEKLIRAILGVTSEREMQVKQLKQLVAQVRQVALGGRGLTGNDVAWAVGAWKGDDNQDNSDWIASELNKRLGTPARWQCPQCTNLNYASDRERSR